MCNDTSYEEFPPITLGGPTGDYFVTCPTVSCQWAEFAIDSVVNGDGGTGAVIISGNSKPPAGLDYTGLVSNTFTNDAFIYGQPIRLPATVTQIVNASFERITNSQKRIFVRIDAASNTSIYVTVRFRIKVLAVVPGPTHTGHPDAMSLVNQARADKTMARLKEMGIPGYAEAESTIKEKSSNG